MEAYYRERASEYDAFYRRPEHRNDLARLRIWLARHTRGRFILEVAAGTGYWTRVAAACASAITATDYNPETLAIAARRLARNVVLLPADAHELPQFTTPFDVGMAHLWWSHIEIQKRRNFLIHLASRLRPRATLLMIDQVHVDGFSIPASRWDRHGNRYERRTLRNGRTYEVVKNYSGAEELRKSFNVVCSDVRVTRLKYFWALQARLRSPLAGG